MSTCQHLHWVTYTAGSQKGWTCCKDCGARQQWSSAEFVDPTVRPLGANTETAAQLARIEAMLAKLTQAPLSQASHMTNEEWLTTTDPHTDDAETERALYKYANTPDPDRVAGGVNLLKTVEAEQRSRFNADQQLSKRIDAEQHANARLISELRERVEKLEAEEKRRQAVNPLG